MYCFHSLQSYDLYVIIIRDVNETLAYETETRPRHSVFGPRRDRDQDLRAIPRDRDVWFLLRDETETETLQGRDRDVFRDLQHYAETMNGDVQVKSIYIKQYRYLIFYSV